MKLNTTHLALAALFGTAIAISACGITTDDDRGLGDAPARQVDDTPIVIFPNADTYPNVSAFCIGPDAMYSNTRDAAISVAPNSPNCEEGGLLAGTGRRDGQPLDLSQLDTVNEGNDN